MDRHFAPLTGLFGCVIVALLLLVPCLFIPAASAAGAADWVITAPTTLDNTVKQLNGDLVIESGGELRMTGSTLVLNCTKDGEFQIIVREGGRLVADRSNITFGPARMHYWFHVNGFLDIKDSDISGMRGQFDNGGISLAPTATANITHCHFFENQWYAVLANGTSPAISDCTIDAVRSGIRVDNGGAPAITGNGIRNATLQAIIVLNSNPAIRNNRLIDNYHGIDLSRSKPEVSGNEIAGCGLWGIQCVDFSDATISGNAITKCDQEGVSVMSSSPKLSGNVISDNAVGVNTSGSSAVLTRNTITRNRAWGVLCRSGAPTLTENKFTDDSGGQNAPGDVAVLWSLTVRVEGSGRELVTGAIVSISDSSGNAVFRGTTGLDGTVSGIQVYQYHTDSSGKHDDTPHQVNVKANGKSSGSKITMDKDQVVTARLGSGSSGFIPGAGAILVALAVAGAVMVIRRKKS